MLPSKYLFFVYQTQKRDKLRTWRFVKLYHQQTGHQIDIRSAIINEDPYCFLNLSQGITEASVD